MLRTLPILAVILFAPAARAAEGADARLALRTAEALYSDIRTATLANGLRVYLKPIPGSTSVTSMVVYKVGSGDEDKTVTGLSHYLEHLMFKGTATLKPGDIDRLTFRAGGSNNAYTSTDITAYHFTLPAGRWKVALGVEADRMRNLRVDKAHEFDKEKGAVINELTGNEDRPWELEYKALLPLLFGRAHPYGHPVIGEEQHVREATERVITEYYDRWYHPNNAALVLVGGFDPAEALAEIKRLFESIPAGKLPPRKTAPNRPVQLPVRHEMTSKFSVPRLLLAYPAVPAGDPDQAALAVLDGILGRGKRSRLYRSLVEGAAVASSASSDLSPGRFGGWLGVYVEMLPGKDRAAVEKLLLAQLAELREQPLPAAELHRVQQQLLAAAVFAREGTYGLANAIGEAVMVTSLDHARQYLPGLLAVTPADVQRVARKYLDPQRSVTIWSVPAAKKSARAAPAARRPTGRLARAEAAPTAFDLTRARRVVLPNGLVLLLFEDRRLPVVSAQASLRQAGIYQTDGELGVASLAGSMLDEGTAKLSGVQIAEAIENVGGQLAMTGSGGAVQVLSPDRRLGLQLLLECLTQPAFPKEPFARAKARLLAEIDENETLPETRARQRFLRLVYDTHPLGRPSSGTAKTVTPLTPADCAAFHRRVFVPENTILAVAGDFDSAAVIAEVKQLVGGWKKAALPRLELPKVELPARFTQEVLSMPEAAQLHLFLGHVGIRRDDPDYYKLLVMDHVLGTGPGFTDRLSGRLRDREGLAYTVTATITTTAGLQPGVFTCYIGTDNRAFARVKTMLLEEFNRIRDEAPGDREVADARAYLVGSQLLRFGTAGGIAGQLVAAERYGLGLHYLDDYRKGVSAVTPADVQAVARKWLNPARMILVGAGAVDKDGKPLKK